MTTQEKLKTQGPESVGLGIPLSSKKFIDDKQVVIEDDIMRIQIIGGMYIGSMGHLGVLHLFKELVNNMIDECINKRSPGDKIKILIDIPNNTLFISDNGRGIPFDSLINTCTKNHSSSKITRSESGGASAGQNGIGLTACAALSEYFETISTRDGQEASYKLIDGVKSDKMTIVKLKKDTDRHGQTFILKPSTKYLSVEDDPAIFPTSLMEEWLVDTVHLLPQNIVTEFSISDGKKVSNRKLQNKDGMKDLLKLHSGKTSEIIHISDIMYFDEVEKGEKFNRFTGVEVALAYEDLRSPKYVKSYCNFVTTTNGGTHENGVMTAIVNVLKEVVEGTMSDAQAKTMSVTPSDITNGLRVYLNAMTESSPQFEAQIKNRAGSQLLYKQTRAMVTRNLKALFKNDEKLTKKISDVVKTNIKIRMATESQRDSVIKKTRTEHLDQYDIPRYIPCSVRNKKHYSELYIVEGDSAGDAMRTKKVRYDFQAVVYLKGVSKNAYKSKLVDVMSNDEYRTIVRVCQAGIGDNFKLEDMFFDKVILAPDADSDGLNISSSLLAFFLTWMRPLVEAGMVYRAMPPLYKIKDKSTPFVLNRQEYFEVYIKNVLKNVRIGSTNKGILHKSELKDLLYNNRDYLVELYRLVNYFGVHPDVLEFVVLHVGDKDFAKSLNKYFPEINLSGETVSGIHEGSFQLVSLNKRFFKHCKTLREIAFQESNTEFYYQMFDKDGKRLVDLGNMSIGQLLKQCSKYQPNIDTRYKGLGELNHADLRNTTLDPKNRILIRITVRDIEKALEAVDTFHGKDSSKRKRALEEFEIRRDELDN